MFNKKPRRNFRQRKESSSEDEDRQGSEEDEATLINKPQKASQSRGISCCSKRDSTPQKSDSNDEEDGEKTLEEPELKSENNNGETKTTKAAVLSFSDDREAGESTFQVKRCSDKAVLFQVRKKEVQPAKTQHKKTALVGAESLSSSLSDEDSEDASPDSVDHNDENEENESNSENDTDERSDAGTSSLSSDSESGRLAAKPIIIPNAEKINAARRQRRAARAQKNYIPLGREKQNSSDSTPDHCSRNSEDDKNDDDEDEPDDHERRIEFAPRMKSIRERIAEKLGESDDVSLSGTDDEEQELWEQTQIGKGIKRQPGEQSPSGSESSSSRERRNQKKRSAGTKLPKSLPAVSVSMVKRRITAKLDSLKEVYRVRQAGLRRIEGDVENAKVSLELLEESSPEGQLKFYRKMILYVHNLVECLQEKVVEVNRLEVELHAQLSDHTEALLAQRRSRIKAQAEQLQQLSYVQSHAKETDIQSGTNILKDTEQDFKLDEEIQVSPEEEEQIKKNLEEIQQRSDAVFSDVQDDFCDVGKILSRFEEWRQSYSESYHSAYISLCLPKLLSPIIRHQLLLWNPLKDSDGDFENLPWFTAVETFCHGHSHEELEHADRQTLSAVIEKTLLPKITAFVELVWDPLSHRQSACLAGVCHRLKEDYSIFEGEQSKPVKALLEAVLRRLRSYVDEDIFIPLYPKKFLEDESSHQRLFRDKQFWTAVKLLENMGKWDLLLPESDLKELMLDKLLNRYLMISLCSQEPSSSNVSAGRKISDCLPSSWFEAQSDCLPQLQNFRNYTVQKVHNICKKQPPNDQETRSAVLEELKILSQIRCYDSIMALTAKYHYEDVVYSHQLMNQETE